MSYRVNSNLFEGTAAKKIERANLVSTGTIIEFPQPESLSQSSRIAYPQGAHAKQGNHTISIDERLVYYIGSENLQDLKGHQLNVSNTRFILSATLAGIVGVAIALLGALI